MSKSPDAFRTISEVADWLGVQAHVLRFWESKFTQVKPVKRAGGRRYYRPADMRLLGGIKKLLHDDGMSIKEVQALLREHGAAHVAEFSHPVDAAAEDHPAAPPADKLGDDWQSSLDLSHEQAAQDAAGAGPDTSNVVGFPQQPAAGPEPEAAAEDTLQEPAGAPAAVSPAAPDSLPDTPLDPDAAEPDSPPEPADAQAPQMRMDLSPPAAEAEAEAEAEAGQPGSSMAAAQELAAEDPAPAAETDTVSPWSDAAAGETPEDAPPAEAAPQEPAPADRPAPLEPPPAQADPAESEDASEAAAQAPAAEDTARPAETEPHAEPAQDTLVAAAGLQPDEPLDFGTGAEPFAASLAEGETEDEAEAADPAASFPPHDLDVAARQVDALEFASGFDPDADTEAGPPQDRTAAAEAPVQAPEPEDTAEAPAPVVPHHAVLAHLAAIRSLPPHTVAGIAACAGELRALAARGAAAKAPESGADSGPEIT
ncbi:MerR family transcriptional regulator [Leisingera sp. D0M16]|uniref:MerR family transcriptional regulator n=1 Tax=Leisingera coralii TaxID=3351347 RepID=UPI003B81B4D2